MNDESVMRTQNTKMNKTIVKTNLTWPPKRTAKNNMFVLERRRKS